MGRITGQKGGIGDLSLGIRDQMPWDRDQQFCEGSKTRLYHYCEIRDHNRPFPSSLLPLFQNESKCETFHMKMSFTHKSIRMQIILIFI